MRTISRTGAIERLAASELSHLDAVARESILLDWWSIDEEHPGYAALPASLKEKLRKDFEEGPPRDDETPLLLIGLSDRYFGVTSAYLARALGELLGENFDVEGAAEQMYACLCCHYLSLRRRRAYDICPVCH